MKQITLMKYKFILSVIIISNLLVGCTNDSIDDLTETTAIPDQVKFTADVQSIINANCISCHATVPVNGAPMPLTNYEQVKEAVMNRGLLDRITRNNGESGLMPNGGPKMPQNKIDIILKWNTDGLQE